MNAPVADAEFRRAGPARFTADEFLRMAALGAFEGHKVELSDGEIVEEELPGYMHAELQMRLGILLSTAIGRAFKIVGELSVRISDVTIRDFDVGVVRLGIGPVSAVAPGDVHLAIEIAVSSLPVDLHVKSFEYAAADIPHYWVVDATAEAVHVHGGPGLDGYAERRIVRFDEPLPVPGGSPITIADITR